MQADLCFDRRPGIGDDAGDVAPAYIGLHDDAALSVLSADLVGTVGHADVRDALQRHESAARQRPRQLAEGMELGAAAVGEATGGGEAPIALDGPALLASANRTRPGAEPRLRGTDEQQP